MPQLNNQVLKDSTSTDAHRVNVVNQNVEKTASQKATLAASLSDAPNNITCIVNSWVGNYVNLKWMKDGKAYGGWETYNYVDTVKPLAALTTVKTQG